MAVSQVYEQDGVQVITYVIPVYQENEVQGALAGVQELSQFYDIIGGETTSGDRINIFWTESDGTVLTTSAEESAAEYGAAMIEEADFGSDAEQDREKIARKTVRWDGEPYTLYCASVGTNGWNLIYIDNGKDIHSPIYQMIILVTCAFAILFLACITVIIYTYKNTRRTTGRSVPWRSRISLPELPISVNSSRKRISCWCKTGITVLLLSIFGIFSISMTFLVWIRQMNCW